MASIVILPSKGHLSTIPVVIDCSSDMYNGEVVISVVVTATVESGVDPSPENIISGVATYDENLITQFITDGLSGVVYLLTFTIGTSLANILVVHAKLAVINEDPLVAL